MKEVKTKSHGSYYVLSPEESNRMWEELKDMMLLGSLDERAHGYVQSFRHAAMDPGHRFTPAGIQMINRLLVRHGMEPLE